MRWEGRESSSNVEDRPPSSSGELARYEKLGRLPEGERDRIFIRIARADIRGVRSSRPA